MKDKGASIWGRWLFAGLGALVLPKCLLCLLAYGAVIAGPELCQTTETGSLVYPAFGLAVGAACILGWMRGARRRE